MTSSPIVAPDPGLDRVDIGDDATLYLGDCLDVLPTLEDGSVETIVADIPYGKVNRDSGGLRSFDKGAADVETFSVEWAIRECLRLAAGSLYIWCGTEQVSTIRRGLVRSGMTTRMCGWEKTNPSPINGQYLWLSSFECCVFGRRAGAHFARHCASPIWRGPREMNVQHPTQKPVWLIREQVTASTPEGAITLDFCMGSGTTGVACIQTGRKFIGIEIDPGYFKIAEKRIRQAIEDQGLFRQGE